MAILKKSCDRLPTQEIGNASECSSRHLKNAFISRICEFYGCRNVGRKKDTHYKCRGGALSVSIQGLQRVRAPVLTVSNQFSCIDC